MTSKKWVFSFAPVTIITIAALLAVSLAILSTVLAMRGPWLGVVFDRTHEGAGIRVERVIDNSPAAGKLNSGDIIKAFETQSYGEINVYSFVTLEDPDQLASYTEYNAFFALQQKIWEAISSPTFTAIFSDDRRVELTSLTFPGLVALPAAFWWLLFFGGASFVLGVTVWCLRSTEPVARVLAMSGIGFMIGAYSCGIYVARELALPSNLFFALASVNHLGIMVFAYSTILFFWYYPCKVGSGPAAWVFVAGVTALWLNETLQWWSWPFHTFYAHFLVAYGLLLRFTWLQWRISRGVPLQRAMLKWLLATMLLCLGFTILLFYAPIILTGKPIASTTLTFAAVFTLYLGLVICIIHYQQFDMQHWWLTASQWLIFILIALLSDVFFLYLLNLTEITSIGLAIATGSIYLLARQWLWGRYSGSNRSGMDQALPHLIDVLITRQHKNITDQQWQKLVERVFDPLSIGVFSDKRNSVTIKQNGLTLQLPSLDGLSTIEMFCCDRGKRLFGSTDINLSKLLLELMLHSRDIIAAREQGVLQERHRIQRDLHDDVAARLLSLLHQTREPTISMVASNALRGLRDVIHLLGTEEEPLEDVITDIEAGAREQLAGLGIDFEWRAPESWPGVMLSSQQHINLRRIARETIANALKHASPARIIAQVEVDEKELGLRISNDGSNNDPSQWIPGRGLNNIKSRVAELGGSHKWGIEQAGVNKQYCYLAVCMPLSPSENP